MPPTIQFWFLSASPLHPHRPADVASGLLIPMPFSLFRASVCLFLVYLAAVSVFFALAPPAETP
ncbi:hypothetical protein FA13DRAFT_847310 [Coprinellus micaceus]|uniref:Uncharacterized protein n=1 Tax=Coprinellus micaceus TaxID=71717 RepID=A0A4Y7S1T6_COPMI|nr:hypothetical protein FA13DRAFT_847310 [Coprinellus micaceus]